MPLQITHSIINDVYLMPLISKQQSFNGDESKEPRREKPANWLRSSDACTNNESMEGA